FAKPNTPDSKIVKEGKIAAIALVVFSMFVAPLISFAPKGLFQYLQTANGLYNVPIFTLILVGMFSKKAPAWAAKTVLIGFIIIYGFTQIFPMIGSGAYVANLPGFLQWFVKLHFLHILAILFVISLVFMITAGHFYPTNVKFDIHMDKKVVDMKPWQWVYVTSFIICVIVVGLYVLLSPLGIAK
ncbi:MAG: solute:sodium symporter family transporter, partial [Elusimicrobium sp.]|nr:solute:sodium symporter family transporter [Elusimicrobium sp.]